VTITTDSPSVTVMSLVGTGSKYEQKENNGISHFLEHMCFKGTDKKTGKEIMRYLDGLGAETNAFTDYELTGYYVKSINKHWKKTLAVVSDIYLNSNFPKDEMEKEKGVILGEISMYEDMPMRHVYDVFAELAYKDQPAGRTILGTPLNIKQMKREDFVNYHTDHYVAEATTVMLAGNIDHKEVVAEVKKCFANISSSKKVPKQKTKTDQKKLGLHVHYKKTDQTHIIAGYESYNLYHKDTLILKLIAAILGGGMSSRLFEILREDMGVGYYVRAGNQAQTDTGSFLISCGVDSSRVAEVITAIQKEITRMTSELVSDAELKKTKDFIIGNTFMGLESSDDLAFYYGQRSVHDLEMKTPKEAMAALQKISAKDMRRVARNVFKNERLNIAMIGPHKEAEIKTFKKVAKLTTKKEA